MTAVFTCAYAYVCAYALVKTSLFNCHLRYYLLSQFVQNEIEILFSFYIGTL